MSFMPQLSSIAPVILAAGDSTRMGFPKALLPLGGDIFLVRILKTIRAAGMPRAHVVLGKAAETVRPHLADWDVDVLINPEPSRGQLSSIQIALESLGPEMGSAMIWPVDMPDVAPEVVRGLAELFIDSGSWIVLPLFGDRRGHPAIIHRRLFHEFMEASLEEGPKSIFARHRGETSTLAVQDSAAIQDIDTPSDYRVLTGETLDSALCRRRFQGRLDRK